MSIQTTHNIPPGYKLTELGVIPVDWEIVRFEDIGESIIGLTYSPSDVTSDGMLVHRSSNISKDNKLQYLDNVFVSKEIPEKLLLRKNDILICVRNGSRNLIGKSALIEGKSVGHTFGAFMSVFRSSKGRYVFHGMSSNIILRQIDQSLGATINQITNKTLNGFLFPLPSSFEEQQSIATALSDIDNLITSLDNLINKKQAIKQGTMQQLLTGKKRLSGFSGEWEEKKIEHVFQFKQGVQCSIEKQFYEPNDGRRRFIRIIDLTNVKESPRYISDPGKEHHVAKDDLFMVRYGCPGTLGFGFEGVIANNLFRLLPKNKICPDFFFHFFKFKINDILSLSSSTTMSAINFTSLKLLDIKIPFNISEQQAIATILFDMDAEIESLQAKQSKYKNIKQGMMQQLLTGKIRLIDK